LDPNSFCNTLYDITEYDSLGAFPTDTTTVGSLGYIAGDSAADSDRIYGNISGGWYQIRGIESSCYRISNITPIDVLIVGGGGVGSVLGRIGDVGGGGAGADGVVIIRYPTEAFGEVSISGGTVTTANGYTYHTFTEDGTFTIGS